MRAAADGHSYPRGRRGDPVAGLRVASLLPGKTPPPAGEDCPGGDPSHVRSASDGGGRPFSDLRGVPGDESKARMKQ